MALKLAAADRSQIQATVRERKISKFWQRRRVLQLGPIVALLAATGCQVKVRSPDLHRYDRPDPGP